MAENKQAELTELEKQQLLGMDLDSFEDLPEFVTPPAGTYVCVLGERKLKKVGDNKVVTVNWKIDGIAELADPESPDLPKQGDIMSIMFNLENEFGRGNLKKVTEALQASHGIRSLDDFLKLPDNIGCAVTVKRSKPNKEGSVYSNLVSFVVS